MAMKTKKVKKTAKASKNGKVSAKKSWEYEIYTVAWGHGGKTNPIQKELNARGAKGWELVGMTRDESPEDEHDEEVVMFVFKRAK